jgi:hypothetical protein
MKHLLLSAVGLVLLLTPSPTNAQITIDTSNSADWKISNGIISVDWLPNDGRVFSIHWSAFPNQEIIDQTNRDHNGPKGFYMDNVGPGSGTPTNNYYLDPQRQIHRLVGHLSLRPQQCVHLVSSPHPLRERPRHSHLLHP